jgi:hypothetical protein
MYSARWAISSGEGPIGSTFGRGRFRITIQLPTRKIVALAGCEDRSWRAVARNQRAICVGVLHSSHLRVVLFRCVRGWDFISGAGKKEHKSNDRPAQQVRMRRFTGSAATTVAVGGTI